MVRMTHWRAVHGDILELKVDGLLCSANPSLNLSGGVGGALLMRYGGEMQEYLHAHLRQQGRLYWPPGESVLTPACGTPYHAIAHAIAIDGFYDTSSDWILGAYRAALAQLAGADCRTVAAACLGCVYGRFPVESFARTASELLKQPLLGIEAVTFVTTNEELSLALAEVLAAAPL